MITHKEKQVSILKDWRFILACCLVVALSGVVVLKSLPQNEATIPCDGSPSGEVNSWQAFYSSSGRYSIQFPKAEDITSPRETQEEIPTNIDNIHGAENDAVFAGSIKGFPSYIVSHSFWSEEPTLAQLAYYYGATQFCSKPEDVYEGHPMIDFLQVNKEDKGMIYSRHRVIVNGVDTYELKMDSDSYRFKDYDYFVQSFHL